MTVIRLSGAMRKKALGASSPLEPCALACAVGSCRTKPAPALTPINFKKPLREVFNVPSEILFAWRLNIFNSP